MTNSDLLPTAVLKRKAVVYVRQSCQTQVQANLESQRRQYDLVEEARRYGFRDVEVIDEDLGRSAAGIVERPGFEQLGHSFAPETLALCSASMPQGLPAIDAAGTTCLSSAAWCMRASSTWTGFTIRAAPMIACFWV